MRVLNNGFFSLPIVSNKLSKGLRKDSNNQINNHATVECSGVIGKEKVLERLHELTKSFDLTVTFPYPQLFIETNIIIVCTSTNIYEFEDDNLNLKLTTTAGSTWSLISVHDFVYMSNGIVAVVRNPESKVYSISDDIPTAMAICNFNGQVIVGAPDAGYNLGDY